MLQVAKWCFFAVTVWYAVVCTWTFYGPMEIVGNTDLWSIRVYIMLASGVLFLFCDIIDSGDTDEHS